MQKLGIVGIVRDRYIICFWVQGCGYLAAAMETRNMKRMSRFNVGVDDRDAYDKMDPNHIRPPKVPGGEYTISQKWITTLQVRENNRKKMLRYDLNKLFQVGGIPTMLIDGTLFTLEERYLLIFSSLLFLSIVCIFTFVPGLNELEMNTEALIDLNRPTERNS